MVSWRLSVCDSGLSVEFISANIHSFRVTLRWESCFNCSGSIVPLEISPLPLFWAVTRLYFDIMDDLTWRCPAAAALRSPLRPDTPAKTLLEGLFPKNV